MDELQIKQNKFQDAIKKSEVITNYQEKIKLINNHPLLIFNLIRLGKSSSVLENNASFGSAVVELLFNVNNLTPPKFISLFENIRCLDAAEYDILLNTEVVKNYLGEKDNPDDVGTILIERFLTMYPEKRNFVLVTSLISKTTAFYFKNWVQKNLRKILEFESANISIPLYFLEEYFFKEYDATTPAKKYETFLSHIYLDIFCEISSYQFNTKQSNYLFSDDFWDEVVNANTVRGNLLCKVLQVLYAQNVTDYTIGKSHILLEQVSSFGIENIVKDSLFSSNIVTIGLFEQLKSKCNVPAFINNLIEKEISSVFELSKDKYRRLVPFLNNIFFGGDNYDFKIYQKDIPRSLELANTGFIVVGSFQYNMLSAFISEGSRYIAGLSKYIENIMNEYNKVDSKYNHIEKLDIIDNIILPIMFTHYYSLSYNEKFFRLSALVIKTLVDSNLSGSELNSIKDKFNKTSIRKFNPLISELSYAELAGHISEERITKLFNFSDKFLFSKFYFINIPEPNASNYIDYLITNLETNGSSAFNDWSNTLFLVEYVLNHDTHIYSFRAIISKLTSYTIRDVCSRLDMTKEIAIKLTMSDIHGDLLRSIIPYKVRKLKEVEALLSFK